MMKKDRSTENMPDQTEQIHGRDRKKMRSIDGGTKHIN